MIHQPDAPVENDVCAHQSCARCGKTMLFYWKRDGRFQHRDSAGNYRDYKPAWWKQNVAEEGCGKTITDEQANCESLR